MTITTELWEKWSPVMSYGDAKRIADMAADNGVTAHYQTILAAFKNKKCSEEVFDLIAQYYNNKLEKYMEALDGTE